MARKILRRWLPEAQTIKHHPKLGFLGSLTHDPNLFHLNRHSVSVATAVGIFVAFLPIIGQMPLAALLALWLRCNLPIALVLVWITNPLTMPAVFFATYELGCWLLQSPKMNMSIELTWEWLTEEMRRFWKPLLVGSLLAGTLLSAAGYLAMQTFWWWQVKRNWERRRKKRETRDSQRET